MRPTSCPSRLTVLSRRCFFQLWEGAVAVFAFITSSVVLNFFFHFWVTVCGGGGGGKWENP